MLFLAHFLLRKKPGYPLQSFASQKDFRFYPLRPKGFPASGGFIQP
jgi:hypothetical protein